MKLEHRFVEYIPKELDDEVLYISTRFKTVLHKCACGCGNKTVTPLSPTDWKLTFNGKSVSLYPSIGNWSFPCQSHYWVTENEVRWSTKWSDDEIEAGRANNRTRKKDYYTSKAGQDSESISKKEKAPWWKFKWLF
ncbi:DUF6527 family protein [Tunicatimonas pelagia]|uniref:DUF6527 family protein n=1 Tax=Tunicatimonas pelagia TaxID=931531 RepID=UPI002665D3B0|nr:DUF6527 family protein [Tunicatimonas pelagia]WKN46441.1 DUF6527 family protein [Tunicatimonas pelagia]